MVTHNGVLDENSENIAGVGDPPQYAENIGIPEGMYAPGDTVEIELSSDDFDPFLMVDGDTQNDDDSGECSTLPARITFTFAEGDERNEYLITVAVLNEGETGKYKLTHRKI